MAAIRPLLLALIALLLLPAFPGSSASAQGFLGFLFGGSRQPAHSYAPRDDRGSLDPFGLFRDQDRAEEKPKGNGPYANYCVRTCDGKFFPVNRGGRGDVSPAKVCSAMCPATATKIFSGAGIENAAASDGQKYMSLPNALAYRSKIVQNCSCNGRDPFGVVSVDIENDPTLRAGDIVVQPKGVAVFQNGDFTPIAKARSISPSLRKQLSEIKVLPGNPHAPFAKTAVTQQQPVTPEVVNTQPKADPNANAPVANNQQPARPN